MIAFAARFVARPSVLFAALSLISVWAAYTAYNYALHEVGPHKQNVVIVISAGSGHGSVRKNLHQAGVLRQMYHYDGVRLLSGDAFVPKAGEFLLPAGASLHSVMNILHAGKSIQRRLTIVEGQRSKEVAALLEGMSDLTGNIDWPVDEGSLFPDTYFYTYLTKRSDLIDRMQETLQIMIAESWSNRKSELPYANPNEALIMASIIEQEAAGSEDRHLVAAVLVNRLKYGMRLQSDPTVLYGIEYDLGHVISKADLRKKTPWNTYVILGLPKTPICNPSLSSIEAALNPADSSYLYFVSDGFGGLRFAENLDKHNKNVRLFRQASSKNIKGLKP